MRKPDTAAAAAACKYVAGYNECATQVTQYLTSLQTTADSDSDVADSVTDEARCCLLDHLADSLDQSAAAAAAASQHVNPPATVNQSQSSSLPASAVYVISPQQVPVTSSSPAQLRLLTSGGQLVPVLLLARSTADRGCTSEHSELVELDSCDVMTLKASAVSLSLSECIGDQACKTETHNVNSQSELSPASRDHQQNTHDLRMWRPW